MISFLGLAARFQGRRGGGASVADFSFALDCHDLQRQTIEVEADGRPLQQLAERVPRDRRCVLHLPLESSRVASGQASFSRLWREPQLVPLVSLHMVPLCLAI